MTMMGELKLKGKVVEQKKSGSVLSLSPEWRTSYERRFGEILWSFCLRTSSTMWKEPTLGITCCISAVACGAQQDHSPLYSIQSAWQWHSKSPIYQSAVSHSAQPNPHAELEKRGGCLNLLALSLYMKCHCYFSSIANCMPLISYIRMAGPILSHLCLCSRDFWRHAKLPVRSLRSSMQNQHLSEFTRSKM